MFARDNDPTSAQPGEILVTAAQLRPGVYVRIPLRWLDHPFWHGAFVIESREQVQQLEALGLPHLFCDPARCTTPPLPDPEPAIPNPPADGETDATSADGGAVDERPARELRQRMAAKIRSRLQHAYTRYLHSTRTVDGAIQSFDADPGLALTRIDDVSQASTALLLEDVESAVVLISEREHIDAFAAHAMSVMTLSLLLGRQAQLPEEALRSLGSAAILHDIGMLELNPAIVRNPERNRHEEAVYRSHCALGVQRVQRSGRISPVIHETILHHHERYNGLGFPDRIPGDQIHIAARVVAIANRFDNLVNPIDGRPAISPSEALSWMWARENGGYDPRLLALFIRAMGVYPPGTIVQLSDGRMGVVTVSASTEHPLSPPVMLYERTRPRSEAQILDLALDDSVAIDSAVRLQHCTEDQLDYLLPRRKMRWFTSPSSRQE